MRRVRSGCKGKQGGGRCREKERGCAGLLVGGSGCDGGGAWLCWRRGRGGDGNRLVMMYDDDA